MAPKPISPIIANTPRNRNNVGTEPLASLAAAGDGL